MGIWHDVVFGPEIFFPYWKNTFGLEIYAANRQFFAGRARSLIIPAEDGQKEFL